MVANTYGFRHFGVALLPAKMKTNVDVAGAGWPVGSVEITAASVRR